MYGRLEVDGRVLNINLRRHVSILGMEVQAQLYWSVSEGDAETDAFDCGYLDLPCRFDDQMLTAFHIETVPGCIFADWLADNGVELPALVELLLRTAPHPLPS